MLTRNRGGIAEANVCCFSGPVRDVFDTKIFARLNGAEQILVYSMTFSSDEDVAMVLPLPVVPGSPEDAVRFINLEGYPGFFSDMDRLFPDPVRRASATPGDGSFTDLSVPPLEVQNVGVFEASFVPTVTDFSRLDARFRLPQTVWETLPSYQDYGFAVFKLSPGARQEIHPMGFAFPTRHQAQLFFPTLHVHDGEMREQAQFLHTIYCQADTELVTWKSGTHTAAECIHGSRAADGSAARTVFSRNDLRDSQERGYVRRSEMQLVARCRAAEPCGGASPADVHRLRRTLLWMTSIS